MEIKKFKGLNNASSPERFGPLGYLDVADNVEIDDTGKVLTRLGLSLAQAGSYHSLWADGDACFVSSGNQIKRVNADYSLTTLATLQASRRVDYNRQQSVVYFSNGVDTGRIYEGGRVGSWGIVPPVNQPTCAIGPGSLPPGRYQYGLVYRRADGQESGTGKAEVFVLQQTGGLQFSNVAVSPDPDVVDKCIYISGPDGTELFRGPVVNNTLSSVSYSGDGYDLSVRLETMFDTPPPAGDIVESYNGIMYVVRGDTAWHSKPYQFERFRLATKWLRFPGQVTMFAAVNDGIYVSTPDVTWFVSGSSPAEFKSKVVFDYGAIPFTAAKTTLGAVKGLTEFEEGAPSGTAVVWGSTRGVCFGTEGGAAINMTDRVYDLPVSQRGTALVRQARGISQLVLALEGTQALTTSKYV